MTDVPRRWFSRAEAVNITIFSPNKTYSRLIKNTFPPGDAFRPHWPGCGVLSRASRETMIFVLVALAAFAAGFVNAVAGGGSFLPFTALVHARHAAIGSH